MKNVKVPRTQPKQLAQDLSSAVQRALVAREFAEITRGRLPPPHDIDAEWLVLCMLADCQNLELRRSVCPSWFFLELHKAIAEAILEAEPSDQNAIALGLARRLRNGVEFVHELTERLCSRPVYTSAELCNAVDRLLELRDSRDLLHELERLALALRGETLTTDEVCRRLRVVLGE